MRRLRRTAVIIASAACMAAAFTAAMTTPALAQSAHTLTQSAQISTQSARPLPHNQVPRAYYACSDMSGYTGTTMFWRCTGGYPTSKWVGSSCTPGEYNAGTNYTIWGAINHCGTRVWLHQLKYPEDQTSGWAMCIPRVSSWNFGVGLSPQNIMVSTNSAGCATILP